MGVTFKEAIILIGDSQREIEQILPSSFLEYNPEKKYFGFANDTERLLHFRKDETFSDGIWLDVQPANDILFIQMNDVVIENTTDEIDLLSDFEDSTQYNFTANSLEGTGTYEIYLSGYHTSTDNPELNIKVYLGSSAIASVSFNSVVSDRAYWGIRYTFTVRTIGDTGTVYGTGFFNELHKGGDFHGMFNDDPIGIDTTISNAFRVTAAWGTANPSNKLVCTTGYLKRINKNR